MSIEQGMPGEEEQRTFSDEKRRAAEAAELMASQPKVTPEAVMPGETAQEAADRHRATAEGHKDRAAVLGEHGHHTQADTARFEALFAEAQADAVEGKDVEFKEPNQP